MEIVIREYNSLDRQNLISLMEVFNKYVQSIDKKYRTVYPDSSSEYFTDKMIALAQVKGGIIYLASNQNKIIGFIGGYIGEQDEDEKMETIPAKPGVIEELFVSEEYRGQKIGKMLLEKMEVYLRNKGCDTVSLAVFAPNSLARNFYKHAGYDERIVYLLKELHNK